MGTLISANNHLFLYWFATAKNQGWAVAEVVKTFGNSTRAETLDEFRYPAN